MPPALSAASLIESSNAPAPLISTVQPKIAPSAFATVCVKLITFSITALSVCTSGLSALIIVPPIILPHAWNSCFKVLTELAHVSAVFAKSPCAAVVLAITYW